MSFGTKRDNFEVSKGNDKYLSIDTSTKRVTIGDSAALYLGNVNLGAKLEILEQTLATLQTENEKLKAGKALI